MTTTANANKQLRALRNELRLLEPRVAQLDQELIEVEFAAHCGDRDAAKRRGELASQRDAGAARIADVRRAIASGDMYVRRLDDAEREAQRQQWQATADQLRDKQLAAARRVDAALAELEAAHAEYLQVAGHRGNAVRNAGGTWSNGAIVSHLLRALHALCPRIALQLRIDRAQRVNAARFEQMVR